MITNNSSNIEAVTLITYELTRFIKLDTGALNILPVIRINKSLIIHNAANNAVNLAITVQGDSLEKKVLSGSTLRRLKVYNAATIKVVTKRIMAVAWKHFPFIAQPFGFTQRKSGLNNHIKPARGKGAGNSNKQQYTGDNDEKPILALGMPQ
ncbi:MAG: hypothetical protein U5L09_05000 [Bacteroidales bacterium]|nr:hypothetical protein [Bacteroidales bacterium]